VGSRQFDGIVLPCSGINEPWELTQAGYVVVHTSHPTMLSHRTVISAVSRFLRTGTFREAAEQDSGNR
jgi:hypothetical protein